MGSRPVSAIRPANTEINPVEGAQLTFSIEQPGVVAIAGRSGASKSSIVALLMKLHLPGEGQVLINDHDLAYMPSAEIRRIIGYVDHSAFLYNGTIRDNITLGRCFDGSAVTRAAEIARAAEFIERLPGKYDTAIGSRGMKLSSGERQRIALARCSSAMFRLCCSESGAESGRR